MADEILTPELVGDFRLYLGIRPLCDSHEALRAERDRLAAEVERLKAFIAALREDYPLGTKQDCDECQRCGSMVMCSEHSFIVALHGVLPPAALAEAPTPKGPTDE